MSDRFAEADRLLRLIVRERSLCERCGGPGSQVAHIIPRRFAATRCDELNVWFLCGGPGSNGCHNMVDSYTGEHDLLVFRTIGEDAYRGLLEKAHAGPPVALSLFWPAERARLRERCRELDIEIRRSA